MVVSMEIVRESIFSSALRTFFKTLFAIAAIFLIMIPMALFLGFLSNAPEIPMKNETFILPDLNEKRQLQPDTVPVIAVLNIKGTIGTEELTADIFNNLLQQVREQYLEKKARLKGLILNVDSPGGGVNDSDAIYRLLKDFKARYNLPIYSFVDGLCASGAMYISCVADMIEATPVSVIGSVGVIFGPFFNVSESLNKLGIKSLTLTDGIDKDALSPFRPWKEGEESNIKEINNQLYQRFVNIVVASRHEIDKDKLVNEYGAKIFLASDAKKFGYIDCENANYQKCLKDILTASRVDMKKPYQVIEIKPKRRLSIALLQQSKLAIFSHLFGNKKQRELELFSYLFKP